jgi:hypothetical protein
MNETGPEAGMGPLSCNEAGPETGVKRGTGLGRPGSGPGPRNETGLEAGVKRAVQHPRRRWSQSRNGTGSEAGVKLFAPTSIVWVATTPQWDRP